MPRMHPRYKLVLSIGLKFYRRSFLKSFIINPMFAFASHVLTGFGADLKRIVEMGNFFTCDFQPGIYSMAKSGIGIQALDRLTKHLGLRLFQFDCRLENQKSVNVRT